MVLRLLPRAGLQLLAGRRPVWRSTCTGVSQQAGTAAGRQLACPIHARPETAEARRPTRSRLVDLSVLAGGPCNDLLADAEGRAYVGNFGFDLYAKPARHLLDACLSNRRVFVELPDSYPDGLCLDAERAAWWPTRAGAACCACVKIRASYRRYPPASATAMPVCWAVTMAAPCSFAQRPEWARNLSGCSKAALSSPAWTCRTQADPGRASCASKLYPF